MDPTVAKAGMVASHYSGRENQTREQRVNSPIARLRFLNNWVKSILINQYVRPDDRVFDLACGKGGDLPKWKKAGIGFYLGVDIAKESVQQHARERYNAGAYNFAAELMCADAFEVDLKPYLKHPGSFDVVSCQFAIHYSFASEARARMAMRNVSMVLRPGGYFLGTTTDANVIVKQLRSAPGLSFGNSVYKVEFSKQHRSKHFLQPFGIEYDFTLVDAVDKVPEYLVPFETFKQIAADEGLELVLRGNFHDYTSWKVTDRHAAQLARQMKLFADGFSPPLSEVEWEAARIYCVFAFKKTCSTMEEVTALHRRPNAGMPRSINELEVQII
eukprot:CAMPEP_0114291228 /NCGR_PEP_ID=MMETSP0059-20121206/8370_1 /TAXON_ID=36894 /ORGANISM="Pyramimonas parkeae, Strain CCMP726" /LENGTH=329 /DNA_ID=CAMNT_0001412703 /DNA_START=111 /DNA_END=1100 /DNA_ORIENTATION=-